MLFGHRRHAAHAGVVDVDGRVVVEGRELGEVAMKTSSPLALVSMITEVRSSVPEESRPTQPVSFLATIPLAEEGLQSPVPKGSYW